MRFTDMFTELVRAEIELWNGLDARLGEAAGISLPQFQALSAIRGIDGDARVQDISRVMSITVGATSKLVDRLERDGLAVRTANPGDRRSSFVALSDSGAVALDAAAAAAETHLRRILGEVLSGDDVDRLRGELASLRTAASERVAK
jgi:DNA-binding MarR family transcriptional regulator